MSHPGSAFSERAEGALATHLAFAVYFEQGSALAAKGAKFFFAFQHQVAACTYARRVSFTHTARGKRDEGPRDLRRPTVLSLEPGPPFFLLPPRKASANSDEEMRPLSPRFGIRAGSGVPAQTELDVPRDELRLRAASKLRTTTQYQLARY